MDYSNKRTVTLILCGLNLILLSGIFQRCSLKIQRHFLTEPEVTREEGASKSDASGACSRNASYRPDSNRLPDFPSRHVRVNFHIIQHPERTITFNRAQGVTYVKKLVKYANKDLRNNAKMVLPKGNDTPALPTRVQYVLTGKKDDSGDDGIYFHEHPELWKFVKKGKHRNIFDKTVYRKFGVRKGEVINVFLLEHPPDSIRSSTYKASKDGVGYPNFAKLGGTYQHVDKRAMTMDGQISTRDRIYENLLNHELGHSFGLSHTWNMNDGCDDTPRNEGCWSPNGEPPCDTKYTSNNVMDYNHRQNAYTPCQIGKIRKNFSRLGSPQRKRLQPTWCDHKEDSTVFIGAFEDVVWNGHKDLEGDVIINNRGRLTIRCRVHLPKGAKVIVKPKAELVLDGSTITNLCGDQWEGIEVWENPRNAPAITMKNGATLENVKHRIQPMDNTSTAH